MGKNVTRFRPGDEVFGDLCQCGWGGFADYARARESALALKPAGMTFEQAAAVPQAGAMALQGLRDEGAIRPAQRVLINGAGGGVGTFAIQIATSFGAEVTLAAAWCAPACSSCDRRGTLISAGASVAAATYSSGTVEVIGYGSRWINNGRLALRPGSSGSLLVQRGAQVLTDELVLGVRGCTAEGYALVEGYDAALTSRTNAYIGYGELTVGAYGTLVTEDTELRSIFGGGFIRVNEPYASWRSSADVTIFAGGAARRCRERPAPARRASLGGRRTDCPRAAPSLLLRLPAFAATRTLRAMRRGICVEAPRAGRARLRTNATSFPRAELGLAT
ncbi:uncharacterized protein SOCE26_014780 [Sorangium cellulosum]|uniref:Enoyl reductase (ER) domain-containing protein n=1 Tax=Sorangium cellulosum TaxID=56 RepID=A0A2L0ELA3_SORCE|nr:hypothetical protein [Sorangium cellulosum]AUX40081.1 uncharacterized protein SOCE26_014780 [Sorangium cellulosum]